MTRTEYEQHLAGLGSWAELLPPWPLLVEWGWTKEEEEKKESRYEW